jgi:hypothetical protein
MKAKRPAHPAPALIKVKISAIWKMWLLPANASSPVRSACCLEKVNGGSVSKRCVNLLAHAYSVPSASYHWLPLWLVAIPLEKGGVHTIILYELLYQRH